MDLTQDGLDELRAAFIRAACVPRDEYHSSGTLEHAQWILEANPEIVRGNIYVAAVLGDEDTVRQLISLDPSLATTSGGPYGWDALTYLCFSRYLRLDRSRSEDFVRTAEALLDAGASPNTGWMEENHQPHPEWESVLYGAAGIAKHAELTRLLLERGGDPNDEETPYHAPEGYDNGAFQVLLQSGKLNEDSLGTMLLRKSDWHDCDGIKMLLDYGVDPNRMTRFGKATLHHAILSDNSLDILDLLLAHGADPTAIASRPGRGGSTEPQASALAMAARRGRGDFFALLEKRGMPTHLEGVDSLIAACARDDRALVEQLAEHSPDNVVKLLEDGGNLITLFAGNGNTGGVRQLLDLGVPVDSVTRDGDPYFAVARNSTALHVAAWRARHDVVTLLIERAANVNALDGEGRTPLYLAVKACVDSYWTERRKPDSIRALLAAGASAEDVQLPTGYDEADALLKKYSATRP
jgi:ankyrin repeat protein